VVLAGLVSVAGPAQAAEEATFLGKFGSGGTGAGQFNQPWDVAVAANGDLYVADTVNGQVQQFTAEAPGSGRSARAA